MESIPRSPAHNLMLLSRADRQGRREKFRAPGRKFRLGPLVSGAPKSRDEQKKGQSVRISVQNQVMSKKRVIVSADVQISAQHLVMSKIRS